MSKIAQILHEMEQKNHIDGNLVKLFFTNKGYNSFIVDLLDTSQIDEVEIY